MVGVLFRWNIQRNVDTRSTLPPISILCFLSISFHECALEEPAVYVASGFRRRLFCEENSFLPGFVPLVNRP